MWVDASVKTPTSRRRRSRHPTQSGVATVYTNAPERRREAIFSDLCTLLHPPRPLARPSRRNSVHKCLRTAPRAHFLRSVYTPASPPSARATPAVATVYTNAPKRLREPIFSDLCTLLRPHRPLARPPRRNSVHKCPRTASRAHFSQSVYTPASPPSARATGRGYRLHDVDGPMAP